MALTFGAAKGPVVTRWTMEIKGPASQRWQSSLSHKHSQHLSACLENVNWHQKTCSLVEIPGLVMSTMLRAASSALQALLQALLHLTHGTTERNPWGKTASLRQALWVCGPTEERLQQAKTVIIEERCPLLQGCLCEVFLSDFFSNSSRCSVSEPQLYAQALRVARERQDRTTLEGLPSSSEIPLTLAQKSPWLALLLQVVL